MNIPIVIMNLIEMKFKLKKKSFLIIKKLIIFLIKKIFRMNNKCKFQLSRSLMLNKIKQAWMLIF